MELPKDKFDVETAKELRELSLDELEPVLGELLEWLQDYNWPVAKVVGPLLAGFDDRIIKKLS